MYTCIKDRAIDVRLYLIEDFNKVQVTCGKKSNFPQLHGNLPDDLPMDNNEPDKKKIKSTIARFKIDKKKSAQRSILI